MTNAIAISPLLLTIAIGALSSHEQIQQSNPSHFEKSYNDGTPTSLTVAKKPIVSWKQMPQ